MQIHRISRLIIFSGCLFAACGCEQASDHQSQGSLPPEVDRTKAADNTARNKVDQNSTTKSPLDQSNSAADIQITADIRKAIIEDKTLSMNADNCKIVTQNGIVTLRGVVNSQTERDSIEAKAKAVAGVTSVVNQLEIKSP